MLRILTGGSIALVLGCGGHTPRPAAQVTTAAPAALHVQIVDVGAEDTYYGARARYVGRVCALASPTPISDGYVAAELRCDDVGLSFAQVRLARVEAPASTPATGAPLSDAAIPAGAAVVIADIGDADALHDARDRLRGARCTAAEELLRLDGYYAGALDCAGERLSFAAVALAAAP